MSDSGSIHKKVNVSKLKVAVSAAFFIVILILADQVTKSLAIRYLKGNDPYVIINGVLELTYVENTGAAFGMMKGMRNIFLFLAPIVSVVLFIYLVKISENARMKAMISCFIFIIAGALGNFIDRLRLSYVVDFIYFKLIDFPVFNVADIYVTCSSILLILLLIFKYKEEDF